MNHLSLWVYDRPEIPKIGIKVTMRRLLTVSGRGDHGLNWTVTMEIEGIEIFLFLYLSAYLPTHTHICINIYSDGKHLYGHLSGKHMHILFGYKNEMGSHHTYCTL